MLKDETVHHKNGNRSDNRIENLELWSSKQPKGQRVEDKIKWAQEIIEEYKELIPLETNYKSKIYLITMLYDEPRGGTIRVAAESEESARALLIKQFGQYKNFEIAQCIAEEDIKPTAFGTGEGPVLEAKEDDEDDTPPSQRLH